MKTLSDLTVQLGPLVPGGQTICDLTNANGVTKKCFVWGGLPGEEVVLRLIKKRAGIIEAVAEQVLTESEYRVKPKDKESFLSTSPWQIMNWDYELVQKADLVKQIFAQQHIAISSPVILTDNQDYNYRNKMEFAWWWDNDTEQLELAHYRRGTKGKMPVDGSALALPDLNTAAQKIRDFLNSKQIQARQLKTLLVRASQSGQVVVQLYVTDFDFIKFTNQDFNRLNLLGLEIIYSNPKSPASVITKRLQSFGQTSLEDEILGKKFTYPAESFFQVNLPVYELALTEIKQYLLSDLPIVDLYSGVGTIGLSVADGRPISLVEISPDAVEEMRSNIVQQNISNALAILSPAESATDYITSDCQLIVDPPRAGLHKKVINRILEVKPQRLIYLSCNPATQARDVALLLEEYELREVKAFNFFPKTPHIETLVILTQKE